MSLDKGFDAVIAPEARRTVRENVAHRAGRKIRANKQKRETLKVIAKRTNLSVSACKELLDQGWTYVEKIDGVPRWESPLGRLVEF